MGLSIFNLYNIFFFLSFWIPIAVLYALLLSIYAQYESMFPAFLYLRSLNYQYFLQQNVSLCGNYLFLKVVICRHVRTCYFNSYLLLLWYCLLVIFFERSIFIAYCIIVHSFTKDFVHMLFEVTVFHLTWWVN